MNISPTFGTVAGIGLGAYLIAVAVHNNSVPLWHELQTEKGYAYFLAALFAIGALHRYTPTSKITDALLLLSIAGVAVKIGATTDLDAIRQKIFPIEGN